MTDTSEDASLPPLDIAGVLWVAALDRVPIEERVAWVKAMQERVAEINAKRAVEKDACGRGPLDPPQGFAADSDPPYGDDREPPDCPGMGMDDLCTWPDIEGCGLCTLGMNPEVLR